MYVCMYAYVYVLHTHIKCRIHCENQHIYMQEHTHSRIRLIATSLAGYVTYRECYTVVKMHIYSEIIEKHLRIVNKILSIAI